MFVDFDFWGESPDASARGWAQVQLSDMRGRCLHCFAEMLSMGIPKCARLVRVCF